MIEKRPLYPQTLEVTNNLCRGHVNSPSQKRSRRIARYKTIVVKCFDSTLSHLKIFDFFSLKTRDFPRLSRLGWVRDQKKNIQEGCLPLMCRVFPTFFPFFCCVLRQNLGIFQENGQMKGRYLANGKLSMNQTLVGS